MRIATSTQYDAQTIAIDNLVAEQQQQSQTLSSGKALNAPSDNPTQIAQDLAVRTSLSQEQQGVTNIQNLNGQLTTVDGALASLTTIMQSARSIAIQAAGGLTNSTQLQALGSQVDSLLQEAIGVANTKYAGKYVFAGTAGLYTPPVNASGSPVSSVTFNGNDAGQVEQLYNGTQVSASVTLRQAFNYQSSDGSPDVFQTLITLRDTLEKDQVISESASRVNNTNTAFAATTPINTPGILATPLTPDANGNVDIQITSTGAPNGVTIAIPAASTVAGALAAINAASGSTGVSASFDYRQQRMILTSSQGSFQVVDVASTGAPAPGNFVEAFGLQSQASLVTNVSRQLGDIDNATQTLLTTRASLGGSIQSLNSLDTSTSSQVVNDTKIQSNIEDADIAKVATQFSQTQTALQAAYATTTRLESKTLFDYLQ